MGLIDTSTIGLSHVGENVRIFDLTRLTEARKISIDDHVLIDDFVFLQGGTGLRIGSYVHIAAFASITGGGSATVGDFCGIASGARILTGTDRFDGSGLIGPTVPAERRSVERSRTILADHAFIGANAVVHPGVQIGEGAVIGSCSVVREDITPWTVNVGAPTRVVGSRPSGAILAHALELGFPNEPEARSG
jgi:acetyltransferase-like isoleucine patch superfamily enzyme